MRRGALLALAGVLSLAAGSGISIYAEKNAGQSAQFSIQISSDQKIVHALNRLTFGPRASDFDEVTKLGLKKWIDVQLHPGRIPENPQLEAKLTPLDTLRMTPRELAENYPPPQLIRAMIQGKIPYPADPRERLMIDNLVRRYKNKLGKDSDQKPTLESLGLADDQQRALRRGAPQEKLDAFNGLLPEQQDEVLEALPQPARIQLFTVAPPALRRRIQKSAGPQAVITQDLIESKLLRAIYSHRQLQEVMTDFWYNHFNVFLDKGADRFLVTSYERDVIRPHVLGKFKDLLVETAESPAMLFYLDNFQSVDPNLESRMANMRGGPKPKVRRGLNENYARELMELHTLGVDGGYTQQDVTEVARCFTGWTIRQPQRGGGFDFNERLHDNGQKTVLGVKIPAGGGIEDGLKVLDILAHHPSTAHFISKKLAMRFVADNPPPALVDRMAQTFLNTQGDLRAVMETMLNSPEFWSQAAYRSKVKSPLEMMASAVRALGADVDFSFALAQQVAQMGQPLYRKQEPTGYTNAGQEWVNSADLLQRMNFAIALAAGRIPGVKVDMTRFGDEQRPQVIAKELMLADLSPQAQAAIEQALEARKNAPADSMQAAGRAQSAQADTDDTTMHVDAAGAGPGPKRARVPALGLLPAKPVPDAMMIAGLMLGSPDFQKR
jgi:uncharacterized protein (DUF1800 family)